MENFGIRSCILLGEETAVNCEYIESKLYIEIIFRELYCIETLLLEIVKLISAKKIVAPFAAAACDIPLLTI